MSDEISNCFLTRPRWGLVPTVYFKTTGTCTGNRVPSKASAVPENQVVQPQQIQGAVEVADVHMGSSILHWGRELGYHFLRFDRSRVPHGGFV
jgi:hypothetical protein